MELIVTPKRVKQYNTDSWHYRLTRYAFGRLADRFCRVCLHWSVLVPAALIVGPIIYFGSVIIYYAAWLIAWIGYYPLITVYWLVGFKPRSWLGLPRLVWHGKKRLYYTNVEIDPGEYRHYISDVQKEWYNDGAWPIFFIGPLIGLGAGLIYGVDLGRSQTDAAVRLGWYYLVPAAYGSLLALIAVSYGFYAYVWPQLKSFYFRLCPEIEWVDPTAAIPDEQKAA